LVTIIHTKIVNININHITEIIFCTSWTICIYGPQI